MIAAFRISETQKGRRWPAEYRRVIAPIAGIRQAGFPSASQPRPLHETQGDDARIAQEQQAEAVGEALGRHEIHAPADDRRSEHQADIVEHHEGRVGIGELRPRIVAPRCASPTV